MTHFKIMNLRETLTTWMSLTWRRINKLIENLLKKFSLRTEFWCNPGHVLLKSNHKQFKKSYLLDDTNKLVHIGAFLSCTVQYCVLKQ